MACQSKGHLSQRGKRTVSGSPRTQACMVSATIDSGSALDVLIPSRLCSLRISMKCRARRGLPRCICTSSFYALYMFARRLPRPATLGHSIARPLWTKCCGVAPSKCRRHSISMVQWRTTTITRWRMFMNIEHEPMGDVAQISWSPHSNDTGL